MTTFQNVLENPRSYVVYSGGTYEPTTELSGIIATEAYHIAQAFGVSDKAGMKDIECELWSMVAEALRKTEGS